MRADTSTSGKLPALPAAHMHTLVKTQSAPQSFPAKLRLCNVIPLLCVNGTRAAKPRSLLLHLLLLLLTQSCCDDDVLVEPSRWLHQQHQQHTQQQPNSNAAVQQNARRSAGCARDCAQCNTTTFSNGPSLRLKYWCCMTAISTLQCSLAAVSAAGIAAAAATAAALPVMTHHHAVQSGPQKPSDRHQKHWSFP